MKRKRFSEEQIIRIISQAERDGKKILDVCRQEGITEQTFYRWRRKYGGMEVPELHQLKQLTQENARLKKLVAERDLELESMKELLKKKW